LTEKGRAFVWESAQEEAFQTLKDMLTSAPILASPQDLGEYILDTDASSSGLGAVLQQRQNGEIRVISYASRTLSRAEQHHTTRIVGCHFRVKQFPQYLLGRHFVSRVDHSALSYLRTTTDLIGQAA
jgi:hypothetical protein